MDATTLKGYQWATVAVALLGGDTEYVDREDVAVTLSEIAPGRFAWRKYPERIDLVAVVSALRDAKKPENGGLLVGSNRGGWMLSTAGARWLVELDWRGMRAGSERGLARRESIGAAQDSERERLRTTRAYDLYVSGRLGEISRQDFHRFARVNEYFQPRMRQRRHTIIDSAVSGDAVLSDLWELLKSKFSQEVP